MNEITSLPHGDLIPWPGLNPRRRFDELEDLRASIEQDGIIEPVAVKLQPEPPHWIFAGERRWRASAGVLDELPVIVRDITEETAVRLALLENIQRSDLTAIEEAVGLARYLELRDELTHRALGAQIGRSQGWVTNRLRLLQLPERIQELVQDGFMDHTQARDLILPFRSLSDELWERLSAAVAKALPKKPKERLDDETVRKAVAKVASGMSGWLDRYLWNMEDDSSGFSQFLQIPKERWSTAPRGSIVRYRYETWGGAQPTSRAFDVKWWDDEMQRAQREEKERREPEPGEEEAEASRDFEWSPSLGPVPADVEIPYRQFHRVYEPEDGFGVIGEYDLPDGTPFSLHVDPRAIDVEKLVYVKRVDDGMSDTVICTDHAMWEDAKAALEDAIQEQIRESGAEMLEAQREEVERLKATWGGLELVLPEVLTFLSTGCQTTHRWNGTESVTSSALADALRAVGHPINVSGLPGGSEKRMQALYAILADIPGRVLLEAVQLLLVRFQRLEWDTPHTVEELAIRITADRCVTELRNKVAFELPVYRKPEEEEGD